MQDPVFMSVKITPNTILISGVGCYSYLVMGDEMAMMIDTGMSHRDIHEYARQFTDLPITGVINTHGHFDHTGGNGWFKVAYMHPYAATEAKKPFDDSQYPLDYEIVTVEDGHMFDLGSRKLQVIYDGAHNPGSIAILDRQNRMLFTGDEVDPGQVLIFKMAGHQENIQSCQSIQNHQRNMRKLKAYYDDFDIICPGHNGMAIHKSYINDFIVCDQMILDGAQGKTDITSPSMHFPGLPTSRRFEYKGAQICYDIDMIYDEQVKK
ncbi:MULTISPECIES: MBL fold metallo-hydrolase [unclassified Clostridium]|uniref:MBL fold metallo-hydrolase n=1 Tax=unclassified Clostridium TaxID=2614128 RepID=UPI00110610FA|nr:MULTISPECIES: MBL fold metallo-hydrolase [unclassified Clostridium]